MTKQCKKCLIEKPSDQFYKHPKMPDGRMSTCKACFNRQVSERFKIRYHTDLKFMEAQLERDRKKWHKRKKTPAYKAQRAARQKRIRLLHPERTKSRRAVEYALRKGTLSKSPCVKCGNTERLEAHHENYSKPLEVKWMCFACHRKHHGHFTRTNFPKNQVCVRRGHP